MDRRRFRALERRKARQASGSDKLSGLMWVVTIGLGTVLVFGIAYAVTALL